MNYQQRQIFDKPDSVPALLAFLVDPVLLQHVVRIVEEMQCRFEVDTVLFPVDFIFLFVPLEKHTVIRSVSQKARYCGATNPLRMANSTSSAVR